MATITINNAAKVVVASNVEILNEAYQNGITTYTLKVTGQPFTGYACFLGTNNAVNTRDKSITYSGEANSTIVIPDNAIVGAEQRANEPLVIPVGTYPNQTITITPHGAIPLEEIINVSAAISFSLDTTYENGLPNSYTSAIFQQGLDA